jgi:hypothetical protein
VVRRAELILTIVLAVHAPAVFRQSQAPTFRSAVELVALSVSVVDAEQQSFPGDAARLEDAVRRPTPTGKTAFYDAVYIAANELLRERKTHREIRRPGARDSFGFEPQAIAAAARSFRCWSVSCRGRMRWCAPAAATIRCANRRRPKGPALGRSLASHDLRTRS